MDESRYLPYKKKDFVAYEERLIPEQKLQRELTTIDSLFEAACTRGVHLCDSMWAPQNIAATARRARQIKAAEREHQKSLPANVKVEITRPLGPYEAPVVVYKQQTQRKFTPPVKARNYAVKFTRPNTIPIINPNAAKAARPNAIPIVNPNTVKTTRANNNGPVHFPVKSDYEATHIKAMKLFEQKQLEKASQIDGHHSPPQLRASAPLQLRAPTDVSHLPPHLQHKMATTTALAPHLHPASVSKAPVASTPAAPVAKAPVATTSSAASSATKPNSSDDAWTKFFAEKEAKDSQIKKAAVAKKAEADNNAKEQAALMAREDILHRNVPSSLDPAVQAIKAVTPWAVPVGKFVANKKHTHFQNINVGAQGVDAFEAFLKKKAEAPVQNTKRYIANVQSNSATPIRPVTPPQKENHITTSKLSPKAAYFTPSNPSPKVVDSSLEMALIVLNGTSDAQPSSGTGSQKKSIKSFKSINPNDAAKDFLAMLLERPSNGPSAKTTTVKASQSAQPSTIAPSKVNAKFSAKAEVFIPRAASTSNDQHKNGNSSGTEDHEEYMARKRASGFEHAKPSPVASPAQAPVALESQPLANEAQKPTAVTEEYALPPGWEMKYREDGEVYYVDHTTKTTSWDRPAFLKQTSARLIAPAIQHQATIAKSVQAAEKTPKFVTSTAASLASQQDPSVWELDPNIPAPSSGDWPLNKSVPTALEANAKRPDFNADVIQPLLQDRSAPTGVNGEAFTQAPMNDDWATWDNSPASDVIEAGVSDTGVENVVGEEKAKEVIRGSQGRDAAEELLSWDKSWLPPPCVWEDRGTFNTSFLGDYIRKDWEPSAPMPEVNFKFNDAGFSDGHATVNNKNLARPYVHPECHPTIEDPENELKRIGQTAAASITEFIKNAKKNKKHHANFLMETAIRHQEIEALPIPPNPFAPKMDIYLRPATERDAPEIAAIYNHYVKKSFATEDQEFISDEAVVLMLGCLKYEKLPCIVAVKGQMPSPQKASVHMAGSFILPAYEHIVGFSYAGTYQYGLMQSRSGRSRTTLDLTLMVRHEYTNKRVGRSLLDRILQCLSAGYGAKDGYDWVNPKNDKVYNTGGDTIHHNLLLQIPVVHGEKLPAWQTELLTGFWFDQEAVLKRVGRSKTTAELGPSKFIDMVVYSKEIAPIGEFTTF